MFKYIYKGASHSDTSKEYMQNLGMNSETIESILNQKEFEYPTPTFESELELLNSNEDIEINKITLEYGRALAFDGSSEADKVKSIRDKLSETQNKYDAEVLALTQKYFGA